ncbi:MAG TPA: 23S rRNA (guanosine(2251)-2'-O)-methyltransferase RlmB [Candidatus Hydrogenedentes bacterium]|nr:23S rRNA (guanosine(2251)-2'-O)-methyltransferase RlmB [Candidatus Hydrogenedentota bacterium]HOV74045.1 23S rRNA (guanosine(2251)-2'-O)-methyltransferase RlmB [Candidatus Hydrogenedentota bacterium]HPC15969.1 23S rRNA (guanosine(2251)-2'-O)-methyltransferase RlmB [Candidatus Hydrogenedentota bacterium]HRT19923.1 23S rRNA (guanosine(2251)-2'-O)-methyltransferase RlmB [Candidatus Hydrogenedentota bacterium]HRT66352.1 23S rRNA (guanosine(2251)-2'-O)-methyltransferase RlmB [Candidatus Hydrogene
MEWVPGRIPVLECLRAGKRKAHRLKLAKEAAGLEAIRALAAGIPVETCPRAELDRILPDSVHQGVLLQADPLPIWRAETWIERPVPSDAILVALDGVVDPRNFGAIVRSAAACGACGVLFAKDRSAPVSPVAVKSAAGGMEHLDLVEAANLVRALDLLKKAGWWAAVLESDAPTPIWKADLTGRIVLIIGGEGKGVRRLVRQQADFQLRIPLPGKIGNLNASVSAGIALAECLRQRVIHTADTRI